LFPSLSALILSDENSAIQNGAGDVSHECVSAPGV
jgi:hypothetical protein